MSFNSVIGVTVRDARTILRRPRHSFLIGINQPMQFSSAYRERAGSRFRSLIMGSLPACHHSQNQVFPMQNARHNDAGDMKEDQDKSHICEQLVQLL